MLLWEGLRGQGHGMFTQEVSPYPNFLSKKLGNGMDIYTLPT